MNGCAWRSPEPAAPRSQIAGVISDFNQSNFIRDTRSKCSGRKYAKRMVGLGKNDSFWQYSSNFRPLTSGIRNGHLLCKCAEADRSQQSPINPWVVTFPGTAPLALFPYARQAGLDLSYLPTVIGQRRAPCYHARFWGHRDSNVSS